MEQTTDQGTQGLAENGRVSFYDMVRRGRVEIPLSDCVKTTYGTEKSPRYAVRGRIEDDGETRYVTKFCSKAVYEALEVPVQEKEAR